MHRFKQLSAFARLTVDVIFGSLFITGLVWMYAQPKMDDPAWEHVPGFLMKIHGAAAMLALVLLGYLFNHIKIGWRMKKNRTSGLGVLTVYIFLIVSGYGLYYCGDENLREFISWWHSWIGFGTAAVLVAHIFIGRSIRLRRENRAERSKGANLKTGEADRKEPQLR